MTKLKLALFFSFLLSAGFSLIILEYKLTSLSLAIPSLEEAYFSSKQSKEKLEFELKALKNPAWLLEKKQDVYALNLAFPKQEKIMAVDLKKSEKACVSDDVKTSQSSYHLPIAKVFP